MDLRKVKKLIELLEESDLSEIEITEGEDKVRITKSSKDKQVSTVVHSSNQAESKNLSDPTDNINPRINNGFHEIKAPMIGTFYQSSEPDAEAFVKVGDPISEGDTLCIIEAMKMMNKIESDISGIVERVLVQNGDPVEFDQVLFLVSKK